MAHVLKRALPVELEARVERHESACSCACAVCGESLCVELGASRVMFAQCSYTVPMKIGLLYMYCTLCLVQIQSEHNLNQKYRIIVT